MLAAMLCLLISLGLGVPVAFALGLTSVAYILSIDNLSLLTSMPQRLIGGVGYGYVAIPMFMLMGELMSRGGMIDRLVRSSMAWVGHIRGGLAYVNVLANTIIGAIMGSANAQTAMMTRVMVPAMVKEGYKKDFSAALTVAGSMTGPIIPPSMIFIIYGVLSRASIGDLFKAGILPGIALSLGFAAIIVFLSFRDKFPKSERASLRVIAKTSWEAFPSIFVTFFAIAGIFSGLFTATESAAVACLLAFIFGKFVHKDLKLSDFPRILINTAMSTALVTFIIAASNIFTWVMALEQVPQMINHAFLSLANNSFTFLLLVNVLFLIIGMFMDGIPAMIIMVPILLPTVAVFGIDPVHFGIILSINITLGLIHPPVGTGLFIASSISGVPYGRLTAAIWPFVIMSLFVLILITYIPAISLWLVHP
jgi:tripartite ATP-independent transporter DctM subunit